MGGRGGGSMNAFFFTEPSGKWERHSHTHTCTQFFDKTFPKVPGPLATHGVVAGGRRGDPPMAAMMKASASRGAGQSLGLGSAYASARGYSLCSHLDFSLLYVL